eukprot:scaffold1314_cov386-Pavlova_lutheri.AAC.26
MKLLSNDNQDQSQLDAADIVRRGPVLNPLVPIRQSCSFIRQRLAAKFRLAGENPVVLCSNIGV